TAAPPLPLRLTEPLTLSPPVPPPPPIDCASTAMLSLPRVVMLSSGSLTRIRLVRSPPLPPPPPKPPTPNVAEPPFSWVRFRAPETLMPPLPPPPPRLWVTMAALRLPSVSTPPVTLDAVSAPASAPAPPNPPTPSPTAALVWRDRETAPLTL